jgi:HlyD family secretion protein
MSFTARARLMCLLLPLRRSIAVTLATLTTVMLMACTPGHGTTRYEVSPITRRDIEQYVTASGTLSALISVDVGSQVSGKIQAVNVDFNSPVRKGQLIAQIDPSVYVAVLKQAEGDLASAEAGVLLKRQNLQRKRILAPQHAASQLDLDQATADLDQAQATAAIKRAVLDSARANLGYCKITAPVDGIVISRKVDVGQTLVAAMTTPVLFTIAQNITRMHISAAISEADIGQVRVGQPVDFSVDAFPDEVFHGSVVQVRMAPTTISNVVTYETIIGIDNPEQKLFPGMTADVSILVAQHSGVAAIPNAALRFTPPDGTRFERAPPIKLERGQRLAYALSGSGLKLRALVFKAGITDGVVTEVLGDIPAGTSVIVAAFGSARATGTLGPGSGSGTK